MPDAAAVHHRVSGDRRPGSQGGRQRRELAAPRYAVGECQADQAEADQRQPEQRAERERLPEQGRGGEGDQQR